MRIERTALALALTLAGSEALAQAAHATHELEPLASPRSADTARAGELPPESDPYLVYRIRDRLGRLGALNLAGLEIHTVRGAVTLRGTVASQADHDRVTIAVNNLEGVRVLRDELGIAPARGGGPPDDPAIVARAHTALAGDPGLADGRLEIAADHGVLRVHGRVLTFADAERVLRKLHEVPGVLNVRSEIAVNEAVIVEVNGDAR